MKSRFPLRRSRSLPRLLRRREPEANVARSRAWLPDVPLPQQILNRIPSRLAAPGRDFSGGCERRLSGCGGDLPMFPCGNLGISWKKTPGSPPPTGTPEETRSATFLPPRAARSHRRSAARDGLVRRLGGVEGRRRGVGSGFPGKGLVADLRVAWPWFRGHLGECGLGVPQKGLPRRTFLMVRDGSEAWARGFVTIGFVAELGCNIVVPGRLGEWWAGSFAGGAGEKTFLDGSGWGEGGRRGGAGFLGWGRRGEFGAVGSGLPVGPESRRGGQGGRLVGEDRRIRLPR